ncbi:CPCC family cysteine-rich protein [Deinococcus arcticus]|uniref:Hydrolase n=1 Tax=Deinococcus arcticus TaxID=2136176 RepID=A0A2T3W699_9DEIO|nr:CPCC family cysteine-rich protein [Deinococcus arcticus]PTA67314.1 hydrolase [Deinococcus arcticus]
MSKRLACFCCGFLTLAARGEYEVCPVCFWEDETGCVLKPDELSEANGLSLSQARLYFSRYGACEPGLEAHVRPPLPHEIP